MPDRPNVLFLMDDEHRADVFGFAGDDVVRTPTIDSLAETGTVFTNAYTPAPVCMPARQCMMRGQLPKTCGCTAYGQDLPPESETFARHFARHGHMTTCAGKLHHTGWDQMQGWRKRLGPTPMKRAVSGGAVDPVEGVGLDYDKGLEGKWSDTEEIRRAGVGESRVQVQDRRSVEGVEQYLSQYYASPFYDREARNSDGERQPLMLKVSLIQPHYPYFTDRERFEYYLSRVDPYVEEPGDHPWMDRRSVVPGEDVSRRELERATAAYYGMAETVDDLFGRVCDALEHHGEDLDDWIIVYTSDHGEMLGERGLWEKKTFYESSVRVPLVIRAPGLDAGTVDENVNLCDLYATLCDLAGLPKPDDLDSRSLAPLMRGETDDWIREHGNETVSGLGEDNLMIKRDDLKYVSPSAGSEVLYDLDADPDERTNRIDEPDYAEAVASFRRRDELGYGGRAAD